MNTLPDRKDTLSTTKLTIVPAFLKKYSFAVLTALTMASPATSSVRGPQDAVKHTLQLQGVVEKEDASAKTHRWVKNGQKMLELLKQQAGADILEAAILHDYLNGLVTLSVTGDEQGENIHFAFVDKPSPNHAPLYVLPFTQKVWNDQSISDSWKHNLLGPTTFAAYAVEYKTIFIRDDEDTKISPEWQSITLLHEVLHAYRHHPDSRKSSQKSKAFEEVEAHMLEDKLLEMLGGAAYKELIKNQVQELDAMYISTGDTPNTLIVPPPNDPRIDDVFGIPASDSERRLRETLVHLQAYFQYIIWKYKIPENRREEGMAAFYVDWKNTLQKHSQVSSGDKDLMHSVE